MFEIGSEAEAQGLLQKLESFEKQGGIVKNCENDESGSKKRKFEKTENASGDSEDGLMAKRSNGKESENSFDGFSSKALKIENERKYDKNSEKGCKNREKYVKNSENRDINNKNIKNNNENNEKKLKNSEKSGEINEKCDKSSKKFGGNDEKCDINMNYDKKMALIKLNVLLGVTEFIPFKLSEKVIEESDIFRDSVSLAQKEPNCVHVSVVWLYLSFF